MAGSHVNENALYIVVFCLLSAQKNNYTTELGPSAFSGAERGCQRSLLQPLTHAVAKNATSSNDPRRSTNITGVKLVLGVY